MEDRRRDAEEKATPDLRRRGGDPSPDLERAVPPQPDEKREVSRERPDPA